MVFVEKSMYKCVALPIMSEEFEVEQCDLQQIRGGGEKQPTNVLNKTLTIYRVRSKSWLSPFPVS